MHFRPIPWNPRAVAIGRGVERVVNRCVRSYDRALGRLRLGGRKAGYDDEVYEFLGGAKDKLRKKHYDKSLRLLWKAEKHAPWSTFRDCTPMEKQLREQAHKGMNATEKAQLERISLPEFREFLDAHYTLTQKKALVAVLSAIGHGEAYAWLVSAELIGELKSTGAKAAVTMQVMEEAKHFVVLRELVRAFGVEVPRLSVWEYVLLERVLKSKGLDKMFGMNVVVEGIALSIFGMLGHLPGMEILSLFHLDESRHTALPINYHKEFPLSRWEMHSPTRRWRRMNLVVPAVPLMFHMEADLAQLGIDPFEFGGAVSRKMAHLAVRAQFHLPVSPDAFVSILDHLFNAYCFATRPGHKRTDFKNSETTQGKNMLANEQEAYGYAATVGASIARAPAAL